MSLDPNGAIDAEWYRVEALGRLTPQEIRDGWRWCCELDYDLVHRTHCPMAAGGGTCTCDEVNEAA